jgi:hypothetical protein
VFGANIESLVERETATSGGSSHMPIFAARCMGALEARQLMAVDGIYRINGNSAEIQRLRFMVEAGLEAYNLMDLRWDTHVLTGALKLFFRELEQPLVPWEVFETTNDILRRPAESDLQKSKVTAMIRQTLNGLPLKGPNDTGAQPLAGQSAAGARPPSVRFWCL